MATYIPVDPIDNTAPLRAIWAAIDGYEPVRNAFVNAMINKFAFTIVTSKAWSDPWAFIERGYLEYGETIEEVFVNIGNAYSYDPANAYNVELRRHNPDVRAAFYAMNVQKMYPVTVSRAQLNQAFLSYAGVTDLIARIVQSLYTAMEYDKSQLKKFLIVQQVANYAMPLEPTPGLGNSSNSQQSVMKIRENIEKMQWLSKNYNMSGVYNADSIDDLYIITSAENRAKIDVWVQAMAFNLDKVDFIGRVLTVDSFALDVPRLQTLISVDADIDWEQLEDAANNLAFVIIDKDFMQVYVNFREMSSNYVNNGLYWNYWLHNWMTISRSPFAQCLGFVQTAFIPGSTLSQYRIEGDNIDDLQIKCMIVGADLGFPEYPATWTIEGADPETHFEGNVLIISPNETHEFGNILIHGTMLANRGVSLTKSLAQLGS